MTYPSLPHDHGQNAEKLIDHIPSAESFNTLSDIFSQLGDESRLRIFWILCHSEECVADIAELTGMTSPAISHHLRLLRKSGLIQSSRKGKEVYYKASSSPSAEVLHDALEKIMRITCPS